MPKEVDAKGLGKMLFDIHTHGELCDPEEVVYTEKDIIELFRTLGYPEPEFRMNEQKSPEASISRLEMKLALNLE